MKRWLRRSFIALSTFVCVAALVMEPISFFRRLQIGHMTDDRVDQIVLLAGRLHILSDAGSDLERSLSSPEAIALRKQRGDWVLKFDPPHWPADMTAAFLMRQSLRFDHQRFQGIPEFHRIGVTIPLWAIFAITAPAPAIVLIKSIRRRRGVAAGLCPTCGYDLRATPDRCPECGTECGAQANRLTVNSPP